MAPAALAALLLAAAPFVAEQPRVKEGNERLLSGDAAGALEKYRAAEQEAGPHPQIDYDQGNALHALGKHAEAREAWQRALERDQAGALSSRALQNMGTALAAEGDQAGAVKAMAEALRRDPANEDARYNLEVLLRRKGGGKGQPKDEGQDGQKKQGPPEQGQGDQQRQQQQQAQQGQDAQQKPAPPGQGQGQGQEQKDQPKPGKGQDERRRAGEDERRDQGQEGQAQRGGERPASIDKQDAEKLLDALRARERQMPLGPAGRKDGKPREVARDW